jgi:hypothetical protein
MRAYQGVQPEVSTRSPNWPRTAIPEGAGTGAPDRFDSGDLSDSVLLPEPEGIPERTLCLVPSTYSTGMRECWPGIGSSPTRATSIGSGGTSSVTRRKPFVAL